MDKDKLKVLHIFSTLPVGGAEMLMLNIVKNIDRERFDIVVCCLGQEGATGRQIKDYGVEVISFNSRRLGGLNIPLLLRLKDFIRERRFDAVHTHMYHANLYGRVAAWMAGVPTIFSSVHNIYQRRKRHRMLINRLLAKITKKIIVGTTAVKEDVKRYDHVPEKKIEIIPYGIDTELFTEEHERSKIRENIGLNPVDFVVGNVARLEKAKGQEFLIKAIRLLKDKGLSVKCLIVGSGTLEGELKDMVGRLGIESDVIFLGTRQDLPQLFSAMDVFVFPSLWEGLPLSLLSAMAAGLPVITTYVGGIKDIIVDGRNGIVIPISDPLAIADAIEKTFKETELRRRLSEYGRREVIQHHSAKAMTKRLEDKYELLITQKSIR